MKRFVYALIFALALPAIFSPVLAQTDKELRSQRTAAHKERQDARKTRNQQINDAIRAYRDYSKELEQEYAPRLAELDTEFELTRVRLQAEQDARIVNAEADFQKKLSASMAESLTADVPDRLRKMEEQTKAWSKQLFGIREEAATLLHGERMSHEARKDALLDELDGRALAKAEELGLLRDLQPIVARPIGGAPTQTEESWNQREHKEVAKMRERIGHTLANHRHGARVRAWERDNQNEDFRLAGLEKRELHELEAQRSFTNAFLLQPAAGQAADYQALTTQLAELAQQERLIRIRYEQIRKENQIKRREDKKRLASGSEATAD
jgi:hypothetical protein